MRYYAGARSVPGAVVEVQSAAPTLSVSTGSAGDYAIAGAPGTNLRVVPRKTADAGASLSALDAAYVLQAAAGKRTLGPLQALAGDVTGDGTVDALDAARILAMAVGLLPRFPAAQLCGSDWLFVPSAAAAPGQSMTPPGFANGICAPGAIAFAPLSADASGQDFQAVLLGDVTGNWQPSVP